MNELIVVLLIGAGTFATIILIYWIVSSDKKIKGNQVIDNKIFTIAEKHAVRLSEELKGFKIKENE